MEEQAESWLQQYASMPVDYSGVVKGITLAANWIGFLTVFKGNVVSLLHSIRQFRTGLGLASAGNGRTFGLVGEHVGACMAPIIMVPSTGLTAWIKSIAPHEPLEVEMDTLTNSGKGRWSSRRCQGMKTRTRI
jgi:hypothetical protein